MDFYILGLLVAKPNWVGNFYTTTKCDRSRCCCIYGLITMARVGSNQLRLVTQVDGTGCPPNRYIDTTISLPTSFKTAVYLFGGLIDVKLSSDSRIIDVSNQAAPQCSGSAIRS
ncbi:unnamed protein product [Rotaria sp. Silwood1]|nr:unnamed protein product [Rotaria sp. Silwood1]CAF0748746.1 unnamed protein product [Rotaria sp. Silwood1]CAF0805474.1 unnamed protein product [Rotaria sp. Silwood1]CAF3329082.1 unnamed protein product [Rotaria sp. Silwood1]CAF3348422.1 unnamed protein product [Rotaria sp. Silwood1]